MPGFNITGSEVDQEHSKNSRAEFRRKHRWRFSTKIGPIQDQDWTYLQKAQRPHFKFEEPVVHHNEEQAYFAGKRSWEPIALTWYDSVESPNVSQDLWLWINGAGDGIVADIEGVTTNLPRDYKKQCSLEMLDGQGEPDESWTIFNAWPKEINWNELDYTNTEIQVINVTLRYDRAQKVT